MDTNARKPYPSDVADAEWEFVAPYLCLMREDAPQREYSSREIFNALRYIVRTGCQWRYLPNDYPPWTAVYQQVRRWFQAGVFEHLADDLRVIFRTIEGRDPAPSAVIFDARTLQSTPESGARGGYDGHKRRKGSKVHAAVDTLGHLLAVTVTAANEQERQQVAALAQEVQDVTGESVEIAYVDQGYTGESAAEQAHEHGIRLVVVRHAGAKRGFVLLPRRWVVERTFGWLSRLRRLGRDYERLAKVLTGWHWLGFLCIMLGRIAWKSA
jgi:transposase